MKARLAKKIWARSLDKIPDYWWTRILRYTDGRCIDHRITKALRKTMRKELAKYRKLYQKR